MALHWALGLGYHISYNDGYDSGWMLPVYGDVRYFMGKQNEQILCGVDGGFLINFDDFKDYARYLVIPAWGLIVPACQEYSSLFQRRAPHAV